MKTLPLSSPPSPHARTLNTTLPFSSNLTDKYIFSLLFLRKAHIIYISYGHIRYYNLTNDLLSVLYSASSFLLLNLPLNILNLLIPSYGKNNKKCLFRDPATESTFKKFVPNFPLEVHHFFQKNPKDKYTTSDLQINFLFTHPITLDVYTNTLICKYTGLEVNTIVMSDLYFRYFYKYYYQYLSFRPYMLGGLDPGIRLSHYSYVQLSQLKPIPDYLYLFSLKPGLRHRVISSTLDESASNPRIITRNLLIIKRRPFSQYFYTPAHFPPPTKILYVRSLYFSFFPEKS